MDQTLPEIPVIDVGQRLGYETLAADEKRAHDLIDRATAGVPKRALAALDSVSRRWLKGWNHAQLPEIDAVAERLGRPGAYYLTVSYEWGCTCRVAPGPGSPAPRLARVLDWRTPGLGRYVVAARARGKAGPYVALTWPGYTGVLQAMAPGRFAAALNQAPMRSPVGVLALDWAANKMKVWRLPHLTPAHLLREVFETAPDFDTARRRLEESPIAAPCIYVLAGAAEGEAVVIERREDSARVFHGPGVATNHWREEPGRDRARGHDSAGRARLVADLAPDFDRAFRWVAPPVMNPLTRLAVVADASSGRIMARGYEAEAAATATLDLTVAAAGPVMAPGPG